MSEMGERGSVFVPNARYGYTEKEKHKHETYKALHSFASLNWKESDHYLGRNQSYKSFMVAQ